MDEETNYWDMRDKLKARIKKLGRKKDRKSLEEKQKLLKELAKVTREHLLYDYKPNNTVVCSKCKKKLKEKEAAYGYNHFFCPECYIKFTDQAEKEVERAFGGITDDEDKKDLLEKYQELEKLRNELEELDDKREKLKEKINSLRIEIAGAEVGDG